MIQAGASGGQEIEKGRQIWGTFWREADMGGEIKQRAKDES